MSLIQEIEGEAQMKIQSKTWLNAIAATLLVGTPALATIPYSPLPMGPTGLGPGVSSPKEVTGKEYSHDFDHTTAGGGGVADAQQVVLWDGSGGAMDGADFSGTRPAWTPEQEIDAIANHDDLYYNQIKQDRAHLIFSHDDEITLFGVSAVGGLLASPYSVPAGGPVMLSNGNIIGGSGEVSIETAGAFGPSSAQGLWASLPEVNGMPTPRDIDGLEVWGSEPTPNEFMGDTDKYSLDLDAPSGFAVWNGSGSSYISHSAIVTAVTSLLGPLPPGIFLPYDNADGTDTINLDALMVLDRIQEIDRFDGDPAGGASDEIIFSIRQIVDLSSTDGYYATGSELFVLDALGGVSFLDHGGHTWDKAYAVSELGIFDPQLDAFGVIDINGIEAIGSNQVPEPAGAVVLLGLFASATVMRWRLG